MKNEKMKLKIYLFAILCILNISSLYGYSLQQFSSRNGLSNSAIQSIYQDQEGFMWFGSCDGLNHFDGLNIEIYKPANEESLLSGNLIEHIVEVEEGFLWIQTNYGLDLFDKKNRSIRTYREFNSKNHFAVTRNKDIYILHEDNYISYFDKEHLVFRKIQLEGIFFNNILDVVIDSRDRLWVFTRDANCMTYEITRTGNNLRFDPITLYDHPEKLLYCFHEKQQVYLVDQKCDLYRLELLQAKAEHVANLESQIRNKGEISSLISHHNDYYIGFKSSGVICLKENRRNQQATYEISEIDVHAGIFCLVKDRYQDVIWIGTDGQGVYMYYIDSFSLRSNTFTYLPYQVNTPVRALFIDKEHDLWIGTKGNGIIRVEEYDFVVGIAGKRTEHIHTGNTRLHDNAVYVFAESNRPILWIGTEEGINYYSYKDKIVKELSYLPGTDPVRYVHSIREVSDTELWVATVGEGIARVTLSLHDRELVVRDVKRFTIDEGNKTSNYFFSSFVENDSIIWFGNRGFGAFRFNIRTEEYTVHTFDENNNQTLNDIFTIHKNENGYWFGTSFGLVRLYEGQKSVFNERLGFPNNTVHAILTAGQDNLWLSTNQGIVRFNTTHLTFQAFKEHHHMAVTEFSDGAYYKDPVSGTILFGGVNGFLTIQENDYHQEPYMPPIRFTNLSIFGKEYNIHEFLNRKRGKEHLQLDYRQNFFGVSFIAIDYLNGINYSWYYKLDELSGNWIENGNSTVATFTNISPGTYTLNVKYRNNSTGGESGIQSLRITILPPWYQTQTAYLIYFILFLMALGGVVHLTRKWYEMKKSNMIEKLTRQQKEEVYESKLRFFTNITHELCTPLTLIYGPCERIIGYKEADGYVVKYATLIRQNVEKLNALIQELIEFRRLETGNRLPDISNLSVSDVIANVADSFSELAETREIQYNKQLPESLCWNSDISCLNKIITNLLSNAFKYTPDKGTITVSLFSHAEGICVEIYNTGKGIPADKLTDIFDRYKILDTFEVESKKGLTSRNGLGLAICHSMVNLLNGRIEVSSKLNEWTRFRAILPPLQINSEQVPVIEMETTPVVQEEYPVPETPVYEFDKNKPSLMIIEDDPSMLWFITEIFVEEYNVIPLQNPEEVKEAITQKQPDLIISDIMMPGIDGISLTKYIRENKLLNHIPVILLSAKVDAEDQVKGVEAGADVYITKPFNVEYLEKVVERLLKQKDNLKRYFGSAVSSYELANGQVIHKEDKAVLDKMLDFIEENLQNQDLNIDLVSDFLGISTRQLYRKIKVVTDQTPNDIIKDYKLKKAEHLLLTTNYSIDEVIYKTGFGNRGSFFRVFSAKYGMTPKQYRTAKKEEVKDN